MDSMRKLEAAGIETIYLDVLDADSIASVRDDIFKRTGGRLDYLVNNAGRNYTVPAIDLEVSEVRLTFETNVIALIAMCQTFAPLLIEARGTIVQLGSVAGLMPYVFGSVYNATKAAIHAFSNTLRVELAPFGVKVVTIITGGVKSRIARTDRQLSDTSRYLPIRAEYERRQRHSQEQALDTHIYAHRVVNQVWGKNNKMEFWAGSKLWRVWVLVTFLPKRIHVSTHPKSRRAPRAIHMLTPTIEPRLHEHVQPVEVEAVLTSRLLKDRDRDGNGLKGHMA